MSPQDDYRQFMSQNFLLNTRAASPNTDNTVWLTTK